VPLVWYIQSVFDWCVTSIVYKQWNGGKNKSSHCVKFEDKAEKFDEMLTHIQASSWYKGNAQL